MCAIYILGREGAFGIEAVELTLIMAVWVVMGAQHLRYPNYMHGPRPSGRALQARQDVFTPLSMVLIADRNSPRQAPPPGGDRQPQNLIRKTGSGSQARVSRPHWEKH